MKKVVEEITPKLITPGIFTTPDLNSKDWIKDKIKDKDSFCHDWNFGLCDNYQEVLDYYYLEKDPRKFILILTPLCTEDIKWHKWGRYLGKDRNTEIVHVYNIYEIL